MPTREKARYLGEDNVNGVVSIDNDQLYKIVLLPQPGRHLLHIEFLDNNVELYAFTFG